MPELAPSCSYLTARPAVSETLTSGIGILIPVRQPAGGQELDINARTRNAIQRSPRCLGEREFACSPAGGAPAPHHRQPGKIGNIARAALVLTHAASKTGAGVSTKRQLRHEHHEED